MKKTRLQKIKDFLTSNQAKTFYWQLANGLVVVLITYLTDLNWIYAPLLLPILNATTKYINQNYL